jgi:TonB family protein
MNSCPFASLQKLCCLHEAPFLSLRLQLAVVTCLIGLVGNAIGQGTTRAETRETGVLLIKSPPLVYPPLPRAARIMGDVKIKVWIRRDGSVASAEVVSGHPLLKDAALKSAQESTFECRGCKEEVTAYSLTYTFGAREDGDGLGCSIRRLRSARCLYLWRCGDWRSNEVDRMAQVTQLGGHITVLADTPCWQPSANSTGG